MNESYFQHRTEPEFLDSPPERIAATKHGPPIEQEAERTKNTGYRIVSVSSSSWEDELTEALDQIGTLLSDGWIVDRCDIQEVRNGGQRLLYFMRSPDE